jgi:hypothetical protein
MRDHLRAFFHWQYSQFFIGALFATGAAMLTSNHFSVAYRFFLAAGIWALIYWQVSDHLRNQAAELQKKRETLRQEPNEHKNLMAVNRARRHYWLSNSLGSLALVGITISCLIWTHRAQQEYELSLPMGWLIPASDPTPDAGPCGAPPPNALMLYLGHEAVIARHFPRPVMKVDGKDFLTMFKNADGSVAVSVDILGPDQKLIARIDRNKFAVNVHKTFQQERPDPHTLIVEDSYGREVLNIRYLNPRALRIKASLWLPNVPPVYGPWPAGGDRITGCIDEGASIEIRSGTKRNP